MKLYYYDENGYYSAMSEAVFRPAWKQNCRERSVAYTTARNNY